MSEPTGCASARSDSCYCSRCDLLVGLDGFHVVDVVEHHGRHGPWLRIVVESPPRAEGCRVCGVIAHSHGRREVRLVDVPCMGRPVELVWRKRTWRCAERACPGGVFTEQDDDLAKPRGLLTVGRVGGRSVSCVANTPPCKGLPGSSARHGGRCGRRSSHSWKRWPPTSPGSTASPPLASMSTFGITYRPSLSSRAGVARRN